jgi:hypothetical protein
MVAFSRSPTGAGASIRRRPVTVNGRRCPLHVTRRIRLKVSERLVDEKAERPAAAPAAGDPYDDAPEMSSLISGMKRGAADPV